MDYRFETIVRQLLGNMSLTPDSKTQVPSDIRDFLRQGIVEE